MKEEAERANAGTKKEGVQAREGKGRSQFATMKSAEEDASSQIALQEVYEAERRAAEQTMHRQDVPVGYRTYIQQYFERIRPDEVAETVPPTDDGND